MIRIIALIPAVCLGIALAIWHLPAWGQETPRFPYSCLPVEDADAVHMARGEVLVSSKREVGRILFLWRKLDGRFLIVAWRFDTGNACVLRETPHDPRQDTSA